MATVQTLKDKNDGTFYPVTKTEAVYNADGSETLDNTLNTKATISTSAGDANKMMKADGTKALVGSDNIDWTTLEVDPLTFMTLGSNFEYIPRYCRVEKFGKLVFARLVIHKKSGAFTTTSEVVGTITDAYLPTGTLNYGGFLGGEYSTLDSAYVFCNGTVKDLYATASSTSNCTYLKLMLTYSTN